MTKDLAVFKRKIETKHYRRLAKHLRNTRILLGLTQEEIATKAGVSNTLISLFEKNKKKPSYINLVKIANVMNVDKSVVDMTFDNINQDLWNAYKTGEI